MERRATTHLCRACGAVAQRWVGRCPECGEWNSLEEWSARRARSGAHRSGGGVGGVPRARVDVSGAAWSSGGPVPLADVDLGDCRPSPTGIGEVDRVLAGGLLAGSVTLVFGEPGVGKSTLLLQVLAAAAGRGRTVLLVSAEESAAQVRVRAERFGHVPPGLLVLATSDLGEAEHAVVQLAPDLVVVDSIQTMGDPDVAGVPGTLSQVRACTDRLARLARDCSASVVLVGHVTKEGGMAGPRVLEHLVDTVISFEGDRHHSLRTLRAVKHRFGPTGEVGLFEMGEAGLVDVADPGPLLLGDRRPDVPGSVVTALLQGRRPLLVEVQALACTGAPGAFRRSVQGVDPRRLAAVIAVLECRAGVDVGPLELFLSAAGGIRAVEPAADMPLALAVASAAAGVPFPADLVSFGEVGLAGEVRQVPGTDRRLAEAGRLGFTRALVPASTPRGPGSVSLVRVRTVAEALAAALRLTQEDGAAASAGGETRWGRPALPAGTMPPWSTTAASR
jgi:DNA repair protein RadA/Sms